MARLREPGQLPAAPRPAHSARPGAFFGSDTVFEKGSSCPQGAP